jgi:hypothetical protein
VRNLSKLDESSRRKVFEAFLTIVPDLTDIDTGDLARKTSVDEERLGPIVLVLAVLSLGFAGFSGSVDDFVKYITEGLDTGVELGQLVRPFFEGIDSRRGTISSEMSKDELSNAVLPTLVRAATAVDLRVRFKGDTIDLATPVLVVSLTTDTRGDDVVIQIPKNRLRRLVDQLRQDLDRLERAEKQMLPPKER